MNKDRPSKSQTKSYPPRSPANDATRAHLNPFLAQAGINVLPCPRCQSLNEASRRSNLHGNVFVPVDLWMLARIKASHPVKFHTKCHSELHEVVVTGIV